MLFGVATRPVPVTTLSYCHTTGHCISCVKLHIYMSNQHVNKKKINLKGDTMNLQIILRYPPPACISEKRFRFRDIQINHSIYEQ